MSTLIDDARHGPLPLLMVLLTVVTGLVDAVSYLRLGHVFVANMTGNIVFLGFALGGAADFSIVASLAAVAAFLVGALVGGRLIQRLGGHRARHLAVASGIKMVLAGGAMAVVLSSLDPGGPFERYALIALLGMAMGLQNATARRLAVPDFTTTVLTMTLTGLAADSRAAGGQGSNPWRKLVGVSAMFAGAAIGAVLVLRGFTAAALGIVVALQFLTGLIAWRHIASADG